MCAESETALIIQMQREVAGDPAVTLPSGRDGETRPASWRLAESPGKTSERGGDLVLEIQCQKILSI